MYVSKGKQRAHGERGGTAERQGGRKAEIEWMGYGVWGRAVFEGNGEHWAMDIVGV